jgi:hypothetical protein
VKHLFPTLAPYSRSLLSLPTRPTLSSTRSPLLSPLYSLSSTLSPLLAPLYSLSSTRSPLLSLLYSLPIPLPYLPFAPTSYFTCSRNLTQSTHNHTISHNLTNKYISIYPDVVLELTAIMKEAHTESSIFPSDPCGTADC